MKTYYFITNLPQKDASTPISHTKYVKIIDPISPAPLPHYTLMLTLFGVFLIFVASL